MGKAPASPNSGAEPAARLALLGPPPLIRGEDAAAYDELLSRICATVGPVDFIEDIWVRDIVDLTWEAFRMRRLKAGLMTASAYSALRTVLDPLIDFDEKYIEEETDDGGEEGTDDGGEEGTDDGEGGPGDGEVEMGDADGETGDGDGETDDEGAGYFDNGIGDIDKELLANEWVRRNPDAIAEVNRIFASAGVTMDTVMAQMLSENLDDVERIERMIAMAEARRNAVLREIELHRATLAHTLRLTVQQVEDGEYQAIGANSADAKSEG